MRNIGVFTTTRAEFGILSALIREIDKSKELNCKLFVGGMHLKEEYGNTIDEIHSLGFKIKGTFDYLLNGDRAYLLVKSMGKEMTELAHIFEENDMDFVCVLGDRHELIPIILTAILYKKVIVHVGGGDITEGVIDEQIRHMVTKSAHLHFASCSDSVEHIKNMGEESWRIIESGSLGLDNVVNIPKIQKNELLEDLALVDKKTVLMTYHPVTLEFKISPVKQLKNIFKALDGFDFQVVVTSPNIEVGFDEISSYIKEYTDLHSNYIYIDSLGMSKYLSLTKQCEFVIGNSSSGIYEIPFFKVPTINIGNRQKGRLRHESVIDTDYSSKSITEGIEKAMDSDFRKSLRNMESLFGDGSAAKKIVDVLSSIKIDGQLLRKKFIKHNEK